MQYLDFLEQVHDRLRPESYLEIGVRNGHSLARSTVPSVGIAPAYEIDPALSLGEQVTLARQTSDDFFALDAPLTSLPRQHIDLAFIDGMHLYEYALRDFMNVERHSRPGGVIVFDDVMPRSSVEAQRDRESSAWTGDVWKIIPTLRRLRPDLMTLQVSTQPTGLLLVLGLDPTTTVLRDNYDELVSSWAGADHVEPPEALIKRRGAIPPARVLEAPFWDVLQQVRRGTATPQDLHDVVSAWVEDQLTPAQARRVNRGFRKRTAPSRKKAAATKPVPSTMSVGRIVRGLRRRVRGLGSR
jgi:hypothetical protein